MRRKLFPTALALLLALLAIQLHGQVSRPDPLQVAIDALPSVGSVPGEPGQVMGGMVEIPRGTTTLRAGPLRLRSGVHIKGHGSSASVLEFDGTVIELTDRNAAGVPTNNGPFRVTIEGVTLRSRAGGGVALAGNLAGEPDVIRFRDVIIDAPGVGIDLTGLANPTHVNYRVDLDGVDFVRPGAACLRGRARMVRLDARVLGGWRGGTAPRALIDLWGDACTVNVTRAWLEGEYPENVPMLRVAGGGPGFEAKVQLQDVWNEPHGSAVGSTQIAFDRALVTAGFVNVSEGFPLRLTGGSKLAAAHLRCTAANGAELPASQLPRAVKVDDTSVLFERGIRRVAGAAVPAE